MAVEAPAGVFISYSRGSTEFVDKLEADLNARSFDPWVDRQKLIPGQSWPDTIKLEIQRHEKMVVVMTRAALASDWVQNEYEYALVLRRPIIPILLEPVPIEEWPIQFVRLQYADFQKNYETGLTELLRSLALPGQQFRISPVEATNLDDGMAEDLSGDGGEDGSRINYRELYTLGVAARARGDLERAAILWEQIVEQKPDYLGGTVKAELAQIEPQLRPMRIERLRQDAQDAWRAGEWGREIAAWRALLVLDPNDQQAKEELTIAQNNQEYAELYDVIRDLWKQRNAEAVRYQFGILRQNKKTEYYGDPDGIAPQVGLPPKPPLWVVRARAQAEVEAQERLKATETAKLERMARRPRYREERLKIYHPSIWVFAAGFVGTVTALGFIFGPDLMWLNSFGVLTKSVLTTQRDVVSAIVQSPLLLIFIASLLVAGGLAYALGYWRALHPVAMLLAAIVGGVVAAGAIFLVYHVQLANPSLRFYSFFFTGTTRVPTDAPWGFAIACACGFLLTGIILGLIVGTIAGLTDEDLGVGLGVGTSFVVGGPIYGFLFGAGLGFLGWLGTGLVIGAIGGILVGLIDVPAIDDTTEPGVVALLGGLALLLVLGVSAWFVVGLFFKLDSALILYFLGGIAASGVAGVSVAATIKIWFTRASAAKSESK